MKKINKFKLLPNKKPTLTAGICLCGGVMFGKVLHFLLNVIEYPVEDHYVIIFVATWEKREEQTSN